MKDRSKVPKHANPTLKWNAEPYIRNPAEVPAMKSKPPCWLNALVALKIILLALNSFGFRIEVEQNGSRDCTAPQVMFVSRMTQQPRLL
jgi:hypothetical protein